MKKYKKSAKQIRKEQLKEIIRWDRKHDKILARVSIQPNAIGKYEMSDEKRRKTIRRYRDKRINKSDRLVKFWAQA